jgi:outer membrane lipoprotein SlyB
LHGVSGEQRPAVTEVASETCKGDSRCIAETEERIMRTLSKIMTAAALAATTATSFAIPAEARHHRHHYYGRTAYRHRVCRRSPATTGTVVGGVAGAVVGHSLLGHGLLGTAAGAVGGAVAGGAVDRSMTARYRCYYVR